MNKIIFSLLTVMLVVAMLLPLTACNTEKSGETGTTAVTTEANIPTEQPTEAVTLPSSEPPAGEEMTPPLYIEGRGNLILHTKAMLALQEKLKTSNEAWTEKFSENFFSDIYENDMVRYGDCYRINIHFCRIADEALLKEIRTLAGVDAETTWEQYYLSNDPSQTITVYATPEQIENIVRNKSEEILSCYIFMNDSNF